ncbi:MAG: transketolase [Flavobacteriaceae bacterium]|nr:transketolase [Flavobacteriaceae bacterium]
MGEKVSTANVNLSFQEFKKEVLNDYRLCLVSRECSLLGRKEVLSGKAKFGILGDGKELPQVAMAKVFRKGDFRSGYYRDQTFALATGEVTLENYFAQLYADTDPDREPESGGRMMNCHLATHLVYEDGNWKNLTEQKNNAADLSPTAAQMPRLLGLAYASKIYKTEKALKDKTQFSHQGKEIAFGTIGDASTAEGHFWETLNAACALQVPMILSIWDDGYGISVVSSHQRAKEDFSELLQGFQRTPEEPHTGCEIIKVQGWNYAGLIDTYTKAEQIAREEHIPVIIHVHELTQPQGHSTSGSHERYKSPERLQWEKDHDCITKFRQWITEYVVYDQENSCEIHLASDEELEQIEKEAKQWVKENQKNTWVKFRSAIDSIKEEALSLIENLREESSKKVFIDKKKEDFLALPTIYKKDIFHLVRGILRLVRDERSPAAINLINWLEQALETEKENYNSKLYPETEFSALKIGYIPPTYDENPQQVDGRIVVRDNFEKLFEKYPEIIAFGEDVGKIGDVNQGFEGLQEKFGKNRISDTGIREATIIGQGIGMAMRGLRPIAEIQYLDYVLYGLQTMSDDLASLSYRTRGRQKAPLIIRTRGHRLEGIWHSGSQMGGLIHFLRGIFILVPRDFVKAAGFYNTMLQSDEPCLIIECLNRYRLKEALPNNPGEFTTPVGEIEITREGKDITVVTYGATWRIVTEAAKELQTLGIDIEIIDAQSLVPFDLRHQTVESLKKTNRLVVIDEDVPGGASSYLMHKILEEQKGFQFLDSAPKTITAKEHRPAYGSDGDYFSKPSLDDIVEGIYELMHEVNPTEFPKIR